MRPYIPAGLWGLVIVILSLMPGSSLPSISWSDLIQVDKLGHLIVYAIFVWLLLLGRRKSIGNKEIHMKTVFFILIFAISFGIFLEVLQFAFLKDRYFEILDIIANIIGCLAGLISIKFLQK